MAIRITKSRGGTSIRATGADAQALFNAIASNVLDQDTRKVDASSGVRIREGDSKPRPIHERVCRVCGCTQNRACAGGCWWVAEDLCSSCARKEG